MTDTTHNAAAAGSSVGYLDELFASARSTAYTVLLLILGIVVTVAALSSTAPLVAKHFGFSSQVMGLLLASAVFGNIAASYLLSPLVDRFGRKPAVIFGLSLACAATALAAWAPDARSLLALRII